MKIEKNKVAVVTYGLEVDGRMVDQATREKPLEYIQGMHMLIPKFEEEVEGLSEGDTFAFTIGPEEGYGTYEEKRKFDVPKSAFTVNGELREDLIQVGRTVPMINASGHVVNATVVTVKEDAVTLDFNHPMAGKTLHFRGEVVSVRDATEKELTEGLHGEFLPPPEEGCHCHGKGHKGGCCHGEGHENGCCHGHHEA